MPTKHVSASTCLLKREVGNLTAMSSSVQNFPIYKHAYTLKTTFDKSIGITQ